ncbi:MAG: MotA/TolQ/Exb proton channel, partial [Deltaproteobacteria bacterium]
SGMAAKMAAYFKGESPDVPMDISKGGALRQLTHQLNLVEQVPKGGPIIWPILAIFGLALLILVERIIFFVLKQIRVESFMAKLRGLVAKEKWEECERLFLSRKGRLIPKILLTALPFRNQSRQDMENALQEAILGEIPRIERFLSTLGMLAAIAPLLGLLGTVTGMINTFHVITYFGAGDPRMMSGGISEALVTTMLGLTVAIPIMLFHTLLSRRVETQIGMMEEKAVAFVNMIFKIRNGGGQ